MIYTVWPEILAGIIFGGFVIFEDWRILIWRIGGACDLGVGGAGYRVPVPVYRCTRVRLWLISRRLLGLVLRQLLPLPPPFR